ncbi:hypothetical protein [Rhodococcus sp. NPDC047139]|uniref:hypothetical protein n=1 Tax=Rhodococcus sp. NPDC047139 TaxID=3155141 RepID=UPI0034047E16
MTTAVPVMAPEVITAPTTAAPSRPVDAPSEGVDASPPAVTEMPTLLEHPIAGSLMFVILAVCGCAAAVAIAGSFAGGLALAGVVGGAAALLVAVL